MAQIKQTINVNEVIPDTCLEITITGIREFKIRKFLGIKLLKLGAWVIGCKIEFSME